MITSRFEIGDVLRIDHKGVEVLARVAGYVDSLDDTKPILVNLRVSDGLRWGSRMVKVKPEQIRGIEVDWEKKRLEQYEADLKARCQAMVAKMTPRERQLLHRQAVELGLAVERRSPLDVMIDQACGLE